MTCLVSAVAISLGRMRHSCNRIRWCPLACPRSTTSPRPIGRASRPTSERLQDRAHHCATEQTRTPPTPSAQQRRGSKEPPGRSSGIPDPQERRPKHYVWAPNWPLLGPIVRVTRSAGWLARALCLNRPLYHAPVRTSGPGDPGSGTEVPYRPVSSQHGGS